jgi:hypothetical protein
MASCAGQCMVVTRESEMMLDEVFRLPHKLAYNIHVNVRAFFFCPKLDWCSRKGGVISQKG